MSSDEDYIDDFIREDSIETETADEMFKKLGYLKLSDLSNKIKTVYRNNKGKHIQFNHLVKRVSFEGTCRWIDMQELKAINKKCEELGWI